MLLATEITFFLNLNIICKKDFGFIQKGGKIPVAWSIAPELYELAPGVIRYYYQTHTENDFFVVLNGAGYYFTSAFKDKEFLRRFL